LQEFIMGRPYFLLPWLTLIVVARPVGAQDPSTKKATSPNLEVQKLSSKVFSNTRSIRVFLPPGYRDPQNSTRRYPVLYLNDGIMVAGELHVEETVRQLVQAGKIGPLLVVGIDNGGSTNKTTNALRDRANEFLPYPDLGFAPNHLYAPEPPNPQGALYPKFLIEEVMPLVQSHYRVKGGVENTGLGGFSYGGVAALFAVMNRPNTFGKLLLESTPLWVGKDHQLLQEARKTDKWPAVICIGIGTHESPDKDINKQGEADHRLLVEAIRTKSPSTDLKFTIAEQAKHEPSAWRSRFPDALEFLFGRKRAGAGQGSDPEK
jgi:predicted alpha/beta superfamily hydrolase